MVGLCAEYRLRPISSAPDEPGHGGMMSIKTSVDEESKTPEPKSSANCWWITNGSDAEQPKDYDRLKRTGPCEEDDEARRTVRKRIRTRPLRTSYSEG